MVHLNIDVRQLSFSLVFLLFLTLPFVTASFAQTPSTIDNQQWTNILQQYVDEKGFVDYTALLQDRESFDEYVNSIEQMGPDTHPELFSSQAESLAYFINAYNAHVIKGVLARGPETESVWKGMISGLNFFVRMDITVGGKTTNLKKLEDDIIRERFKDPRIHAALNCASIGCPRLIQQAYIAETLESQLDLAMIDFLNDDKHIMVEKDNNQVWISKIFDWYEEDFLNYEKRQGNKKKTDGQTLISYINRYRSADSQIPDSYKVKILDYDKGINAQ